jgi:hypothetical protein
MMECHEKSCTSEATMALRTQRPTRDNLKTTIFWDNRALGVPKAAEHYCGEHGMKVVNELAKVLA